MATLVTTPIKTFISGETVVPATLNQLGQSTVALTAGTIVDADVSASAAIALSKLATGALPAAITTTTANIVDASVTAAKLDGAQTGSAPIYGCRAWVNFDGLLTNVAGSSYSRTGTTVTVTKSSHGLTSGNRLRISSATDAGLNTAALTASTVITVTDANNFTFQTSSTGASTGTLDYARGIRASGNVASMARNGVGDFTVTFSEPMPDANYSVCAMAMNTGTSINGHVVYEMNAGSRTVSSCRIGVSDNQLDNFIDPLFGVCVQVFR